MRIPLIITLITFAGLTLKAQPNLDSLWGLWNDKTQYDTTRLKAMQKIAWDGYLFSQPDSAFYFAQMQFDLAEKSGLKNQMAHALHTQGASFYISGDYSKALGYYQRSLKIKEETGDKKGIGSTLVGIGNIYMDQGDYPKALEYYQRSLKIAEEVGDNKVIGITLNNIGINYALQSDYPKALEYHKRGLKHRKGIGDKKGISASLTNIGNIYKIQGNYSQALGYYQRSLKIKEEIGDKSGIGNALAGIGSICLNQGDYPKALGYYQRSLKINEEVGDKKGIGLALGSIGRIYTNQGDYPKALEFFERTLKIFEETGDNYKIGRILSSIGRIYEKKSNYPKALGYYQRSLKIKEAIGDNFGISVSLNTIGGIYNAESKHQDAIIRCQKALEISEEIGVITIQKNACSCLYEAHKAMGKGNEALVYLEKTQVLDDSLHAEETTKKLEQMEFAKIMLQDSISKAEEVRLVQEAYQEEIRKNNRTRNILVGGALLLILLAGGIYSRLRYVRKSRAIIEAEKDRSNNLLLNILPADIAEELKIHGKAEARDFERVSILFTDFKGFTEKSAKMSAADLVNEINVCFESFDGIMAKYAVEKIKTIGDAYMAAGGLSVLTDDSVKNTVLAALEMQNFIATRKDEMDATDKPAFEMRLGIHTGPVVAGIVGVKKFQYDIWGDTVNTASRMESSGEVGKVNISQATYDLLKHNAEFAFESRGKIVAKGKGEIAMYFVSKA